jgi:dUTPase
MTYPRTHLKIKIDPEYKDVLMPYYEEAIEKFNSKLNEKHRDSGFDLYVPKHFTNIDYKENQPIVVDHQVSCALYDDNGVPLPYYMYPRSSISKSPFRLANQVGIIDSGYRGHLIAKVDCICGEAYDHGESETVGMGYIKNDNEMSASGSIKQNKKKNKGKKRLFGKKVEEDKVVESNKGFNVENNLFIRTIKANRVGKYSNFYEGQVGSRMFQLCAYNMLPFSSVELVDELDDTERGSGGFGSTGK